MLWTLLEAVVRAAHRWPQKVAADLAPTFGHSFFTTFVVGVVQVVLGCLGTRVSGATLRAPPDQVIGSCLFGTVAVATLTLGNYSLQLGGDVGVYTFIVTLSIVPGTMIDHWHFHHRQPLRAWIGVAVAALAGYSVLGWPSLEELQHLPRWVLVAGVVPILLAVNQGITQRVKDVDVFVKNVWGGGTTVVLCVVGLVATDSTHLLRDFSVAMRSLWLWSALLGVFIVGIWCTNLMSYKGGAGIALKKLIMNGTFLTLAMGIGVVVFGEPLTAGKVVGVGLYFVGFALMDKGTWEFVRGRFTRRA